MSHIKFQVKRRIGLAWFLLILCPLVPWSHFIVFVNNDCPSSGKTPIKCALVGNSGILLNGTAGGQIDEFDVVARLNYATTRGYESHVGTKSSIRIFGGWITAEKEFGPACSPRELESAPCTTDLAMEIPEGNETIYIMRGRRIPKFNFKMVNKSSYLRHIIWFDEIMSFPTNWTIEYTPTNWSTGVWSVFSLTRFCDEIAMVGFEKSPSAETPYHYFDDPVAKGKTQDFVYNLPKAHPYHWEKAFLKKLEKRSSRLSNVLFSWLNMDALQAVTHKISYHIIENTEAKIELESI
ncbi:hypothetical protein M9434_004885 [Picochlorum sp. BPE23]|nr:hypothetical protein M9434_004885 [Picochlorum sp. BPE23]